jgi:hypothetical protein
MNSQSKSNGRQPEDTTGTQGWQEVTREEYIQLETCATDGIFEGKTRQYIVHIENSSESRPPFIVKEVKTAPELFQAICDVYPKFCHENLLMRVSDTRAGSPHRIFYGQELPVHTDSLYVQLILRRHGPLFASKIEKE